MGNRKKKIAVIGETENFELTHDTYHSLMKLVPHAEGPGVDIELILTGTPPKDLECLPCDRVVVYPDITGSNELDKNLAALEHWGASASPSLIVVSTSCADRLVPALACRWGGPGFLSCDEINYQREDDELMISKSVYGGNALAHFILDELTVISFNCSGNSSVVLPGGSPEIHIENYHGLFHLGSPLKSEREYFQTQDLTKADFVIVCGRGVGSKAVVEKVVQWAESMGAVVGGTKKVIDQGWLPVHKLIGQTGNVISPSTCLVIGASGATPFINGILGSDKIIAVNSDSEARIFDYADVGVVEEANQIIADLIDGIKPQAGFK